MDFHVFDFIEFAIVGLIGGLIVLMLPWRREREFVARTTIAASPERIREAYLVDPANLYSSAMHPAVTATEWLDDARRDQRLTLDSSGGHRTSHTTARSVTLLDEPPWRVVTHVAELDGKSDPFGSEQLEALVLEPRPRGTEATILWWGETANLFQFLAIRREVSRFTRRLAKVCAGDPAPASPAKSGMPWKSIALSVVAVGAFSWVFGWVFGLMLCGILLVHEFGHWLAMRMTGQPAPRMMLIPFLGGVAVGNHPHKTLFHDAFCSLMGPGFSVLPCLGLVGLVQLLVPGESSFGWALGYDDLHGPLETTIFVAIALAAVAAILNLLQMVPVLPLDGGQILRAVLQSFGGGWARWGLLVLTGGGLYLLLAAGDYILAAVLGLGLLQAWHLGGEASTARPMRLPGLAAIGASYAGVLAAYVGVFVYTGWLFGIDFMSVFAGDPVFHPDLLEYQEQYRPGY